MLYSKNLWAADVLLKQRPSRTKRNSPIAIQRNADRLRWARFAIAADDVLFRLVILPLLVPSGKQKSKLRSAVLHIRSHYTAKQLVLGRIEEYLKLL